MIDYKPEDEQNLGIATVMKKPFSFSITLDGKTTELKINLRYFEKNNGCCLFEWISIDRDVVYDSDETSKINDCITAWVDYQYPDETLQDEKNSVVKEILKKISDFIEEKGIF